MGIIKNRRSQIMVVAAFTCYKSFCEHVFLNMLQDVLITQEEFAKCRKAHAYFIANPSGQQVAWTIESVEAKAFAEAIPEAHRGEEYSVQSILEKAAK